jgi:hypothetical protein
MLRENRKLWQFGFGVLAFISGLLGLFFLCWSYAELLPLFSQFSNPVKHYEPGSVFGISETGYQLCRAGFIAFFMLSLAGIYVFRGEDENGLKPFFPNKTVAFFAGKLSRVWRQLPASEKKLLIITSLVLLAARILFLFRLPFRVDEITTFEVFVNRGLPGILLFYPIPNNHILFSLLCLPFTWFFTDGFWIVKLPSLLLSTVSFPVIYLALRSYFGFPITYVGWSGYSFSYFALTYAVNGRGYSLLAVCCALLTIAVLKLMETREVRYWLVFMVSVVAGFYTIPIFIYPFAAVFFAFALVLLFKRDWNLLVSLLLASGFSGLGVILLYTPVVAVSNLELLVANRYVQSLSRLDYFSYFFSYLHNRQGIVLGQETIGFYVWAAGIFGLSLFLLFRNRLKNLLRDAALPAETVFIFLLASVLPWLFMALQRIYPEPRIWTFKTFYDFLLLAFFFRVILSFFLQNREKLQLIILIAGGILYNLYEIWKLYRGLMYW